VSYIGLIAEYRIRLYMLRYLKENDGSEEIIKELEWWKRVLRAKIRSRVKSAKSRGERLPKWINARSAAVPISTTSTGLTSSTLD
jgi:hypothetical protein